MPWVQVGPSDIYYQEAGQGQPLVLLHGMSSCAEAWFQQFEAFSPFFRVVAYDSVNHGHSANSPRGQPEPDRADELEGFLQALGLARPIIAGNSMGALTALRWAVRHPDEAAALVPSGMGVGPFPDGMARRRTEPLDEHTLFIPVGDALTEGLRTRDPLLYERYLRIRSTATRLEALRHPRTRSMAGPSREDLDLGVATIRSPMLVVVGELDWLLPNAHALAAAVPEAKLHVVSGSPHNVYYETAAEYNQVVSGFLAEHKLMPAGSADPSGRRQMTEPVAGGKILQTQIGRYRSTRGLDYDSVPWKLWEKSKKLFWDPADLDFSQDAVDWQEMSDEERTLVALSARGFMVGEEAVTLDIVPLLRCMSDLGRLEDTMYLSMFAMEEAKHTDMFRRWFDAVGLDPATLDDLVLAQQAALGQHRPGLFDGALTKVMRRLDTDRSPRAILDATLIYNQLVEGVAAIAGYRRWEQTFRRLGKLPGLEAGIKLTQRDERRHIAYGTYLGRQIIAENPDLWEWVEQRWAKLTAGFGGGYGADPKVSEQRAAMGFDDEYQQGLIKRRLEALAVARTMNIGQVNASAVETFEPEELRHVG